MQSKCSQNTVKMQLKIVKMYRGSQMHLKCNLARYIQLKYYSQNSGQIQSSFKGNLEKSESP